LFTPPTRDHAQPSRMRNGNYVIAYYTENLIKTLSNLVMFEYHITSTLLAACLTGFYCV